MNRIRIADLEIQVKKLNSLTGNPTEYRNSNPEARAGSANVGHHYIDQAYGGYKLVQIMNPAGGIREVSRDGFGTKRQLWDFVQNYIRILGEIE